MSKLKMKRKRYVCHRCNATHEYPRTYLAYKDGYGWVCQRCGYQKPVKRVAEGSDNEQT